MTVFTKYHGLGNDFVLVDGEDEQIDRSRVRSVCHRRRGVGADGVLVVSSPSDPEAAGKMTLFNRDGTRPEMCGNGIRCVVRHLVERGGVDPSEPVAVETDDGLRRCEIVSEEPGAWLVSVEMGRADVGEARLERSVGDVRRTFVPVDVGNPHAVSFEPTETEDVDAFGEMLNAEGEPFPDGVNVEFADVSEPDEIDVVVYERGVGRTRACGTGATAVAAAAWRTGRADPAQPANVALPGGSLEIRRDESGVLWMTGPAVAVFRGELYDSAD